MTKHLRYQGAAPGAASRTARLAGLMMAAALAGVGAAWAAGSAAAQTAPQRPQQEPQLSRTLPAQDRAMLERMERPILDKLGIKLRDLNSGEQENLARVLPALSNLIGGIRQLDAPAARRAPQTSTILPDSQQLRPARPAGEIDIRKSGRQIPYGDYKGKWLQPKWDRVGTHMYDRARDFQGLKLHSQVTADKLVKPLMPVAMPYGAEWTDRLRIVPRDYGYIVSGEYNGLTVEIVGTRLGEELTGRSRVRTFFEKIRSQRLQQRAGAGLDAEDDIFITDHEYGIDATSTLWGCNFNVSLLCEDPNDPRCSEEYVRKLIKSLLIVGGSRPMED